VQLIRIVTSGDNSELCAAVKTLLAKAKDSLLTYITRSIVATVRYCVIVSKTVILFIWFILLFSRFAISVCPLTTFLFLHLSLLPSRKVKVNVDLYSALS